MGNWNINIQGVGCHHNKDEKIDANIAAKRFVEFLIGQGHTIQHATFTYGSKEELFLPVDGETLPIHKNC